MFINEQLDSDYTPHKSYFTYEMITYSMNLKILALLLFVVVILPIVVSKSKNNATKSSESPKSLKSKNNATKSSESAKKHKQSKRKPSKCKCKPPKSGKSSISKNNATKSSESPKTPQNQRIFMGDVEEKAPYQILIEIRFDQKSDYERYGGALLSQKYIITVAHIFRPYKEEGIDSPNEKVNGLVHAGVFDKTHVGQARIQSREIQASQIVIFPRKYTYLNY